MNKNFIGGAIVIALLALLVGTVVFAGRSPTGASAASSGSGSYDGYDSYEAMMQAHHGGSASAGASEDGCGGVSTGTGAASFAGEMAPYGLTYDDAGYQELLKAEKSITLTAAQTSTIVGLDILLPCCGVQSLQAKDNCQCGHHVAMFGLAKMLAKEGYSRDQIQDELNKWKEVFYPGGATGTGGC
ncbi:hypothetical protein HY493_00490 [Candidatus Woesearchaeota archaeon]|nr:hypothetical protein [Candidatus Woesearchaeota archaeon]